jgi:tripartite-type tricarboxylate transporter receptor subunit TctC
MLKSRKSVLWAFLFFAVSAAVLGANSVALSAEYPNKTIECAICWTPGSASDMAIRMICNFAEKNLGVAIAPINMVGGNGAVAWEHLHKAKPDGYTIGLVTFDVLTNQIMGSEVKYDSFHYLLQFTRQPMGLYVHADSPYKTVEEFVEGAKANPGKISCGTTSLGGLLHQAGFFLQDHYGIELRYVPFKGSAMIMSQLLGKHLDSGINTITKMAPHVESGTIRMLMSFSDVTLESYPNVPNIKELGVSEVGFESWRAVAIPKGVPEMRKLGTFG